jgi:L-lactate dehydrogenase complex protein LldF
VKINLHHHLLQNRRNAMAQKPVWWEKLAFKMFAFVVNRPRLYDLGKKLGRIGQLFHPLVKGTLFDPARSWTQTRELPELAPQSFHEIWKERKK